MFKKKKKGVKKRHCLKRQLYRKNKELKKTANKQPIFVELIIDLIDQLIQLNRDKVKHLFLNSLTKQQLIQERLI